MTRTSLGIAVAGAAVGVFLTACAKTDSSNVSQISPGIPTANVIANQLNNSGLSCEGPIEASATGAVEALDCGGGLKIETFATAADRDKAYAIAPAGSGVAVFVGPNLVQAPNAQTAKRAAAIVGGILPPAAPTPSPTRPPTPRVTSKTKVSAKPARPATKVAPRISPTRNVPRLGLPTHPAAKTTK